MGNRKGYTEYKNFLNKKPLTYADSLWAQCYQCYLISADDDKLDCMCDTCPIYPHMWYNPNRVAKTRIMTSEEKEIITKRINKVNSDRKLNLKKRGKK